jgi:ornithine decarboxylase
MKPLSISESAKKIFPIHTTRELIDIKDTDFPAVSAVIVTKIDIEWIQKINSLHFDLPIIVVIEEGNEDAKNHFSKFNSTVVIDSSKKNLELYSRKIENLAKKYESKIDSPFFRALKEYTFTANSEFDCPGHQGGEFFMKHPAGKSFVDFFGENLFRADLCNADVKLGDLLIHEGPAYDAQKHAAKVFNADKTYFVLNGASTANRIVANAIVAPGDLVLFDRNNHKSCCHGALIQGGGIPLYLQTSRNAYGTIGGIFEECFKEDYIRNLIKEKCPEKAELKRPIRLAIIVLESYDGVISNAKQIIEKIGKLCDYILFTCAFVGYEQFIPMMKVCSPLLVELGPEDPGIIVTQSVNKQLAGFSQTSQIHKKDNHINGQDRYVTHKRFNNAYMMNSSTSPFYPLFAALDVNAKIHDGKAGKQLWISCVKLGIDARKMILKNCKYIKPLVPPVIKGKKWEEGDTEEMANNMEYFLLKPGEKWHGFEGYGENQYFLDPCKLNLLTPGINIESGQYEDFGIPAIVLAQFLRENMIIPEKCETYDILFLLTPAESFAKIENLVNQLCEFERYLDQNKSVEKIMPDLVQKYKKYSGYKLKQLCQEIHDFYKSKNISEIQRNLSLKKNFPEYIMSPFEANVQFIKGNGELIPVSECEGRIALEGVLCYPPGIICIQPGEKWNKNAQNYFLCLEDIINNYPGFGIELQGAYEQKEEGKVRTYVIVLKKEFEPKL